MALNLCQTLVFAQDLEIEWTELNQVCIHITINMTYIGIVTHHQFFEQSYVPEYIFVL